MRSSEELSDTYTRDHEIQDKVDHPESELFKKRQSFSPALGLTFGLTLVLGMYGIADRLVKQRAAIHQVIDTPVEPEGHVEQLINAVISKPLKVRYEYVTGTDFVGEATIQQDEHEKLEYINNPQGTEKIWKRTFFQNKEIESIKFEDGLYIIDISINDSLFRLGRSEKGMTYYILHHNGKTTVNKAVIGSHLIKSRVKLSEYYRALGYWSDDPKKEIYTQLSNLHLEKYEIPNPIPEEAPILVPDFQRMVDLLDFNNRFDLAHVEFKACERGLREGIGHASLGKEEIHIPYWVKSPYGGMLKLQLNLPLSDEASKSTISMLLTDRDQPDKALVRWKSSSSVPVQGDVSETFGAEEQRALEKLQEMMSFTTSVVIPRSPFEKQSVNIPQKVIEALPELFMKLKYKMTD